MIEKETVNEPVGSIIEVPIEKPSDGPNRKQMRKRVKNHPATHEKVRVIRVPLGKSPFGGGQMYDYKTATDVARPTKPRPWTVRAKRRAANRVARQSRRVNRRNSR